MAKYPWRCEHPETGDVKMAAKTAHKDKLEDDGYVCEVYPDENWTEIPTVDPNVGP